VVRSRIGRAPLLALTLLVATGLVACSDDGEATTATSTTAEGTRSSPPSTEPASDGCGRSRVPPGVSERTMTSEGVERRFQLTVPEGYDGTTPLPVVLGLHALTVSHQVVANMIGFADMAERYEFIGVAPSGRLDGTTPYWLAAPAPDNYDITFIDELLDRLEADLCVDPSRVFATGMSNGGQMSSLLACRLPDRFAAVAPVAGVEFYESCEDGPVPVIAFHGRADPIVTYEGGGLNATRIADVQYWKGDVPDGLPEHEGVDVALATWARHNGCDTTFAEEQVSPSVRRRTWPGCEAETVLYVVDGGGHAWPGKPVPQFEDAFGPGTTEIDGSSLIFEFFLG
jgi:polyhydroxybutyrate depolymerase